MTGSCRINGCGKKEVARLLCYRHYTSERKYGSPEYIDSEAHRVALHESRSRAAKAKPLNYWLGKKRGPHSKETREKMSRSHLANGYRGKSHHRFGKAPAHIRRIEYNGTIFRSNYEVRFAKMLDEMEVKWEYESHRFDLVESTYLPDFYLPEYRSYYEVKGWLDSRAQRKLELFKELYPSVPLILVPKPFFKKHLDRRD